jgi:hypothetical protein
LSHRNLLPFRCSEIEPISPGMFARWFAISFVDLPHGTWAIGLLFFMAH